MVIHNFTPTPRFVLIGEKIDHSLSPSLHNNWMKNKGISESYGLLKCQFDHLSETWQAFWKNGLGANVTAPFKKTVYEWVTIEDPLTARIGALNTIYVRDNKLYGYNTDVRAAIDLIEAGESALIYGAGGAAAAVAVALQEKGFSKIYMVYRTQKPNLDVTFIPVGSPLPRNVDIVINAMPVEIEPDVTYAQALDLLYVPERTKLIIQAERTGATVKTGYAFLVRQAQYSFEKWFGVFPESS